jgi:hypothetical protein
VAYAIESGRVIVSKAPVRRSRDAYPAQDPFAAFAEWDSDADRAAFANL